MYTKAIFGALVVTLVGCVDSLDAPSAVDTGSVGEQIEDTGFESGDIDTGAGEFESEINVSGTWRGRCEFMAKTHRPIRFEWNLDQGGAGLISGTTTLPDTVGALSRGLEGLVHSDGLELISKDDGLDWFFVSEGPNEGSRITGEITLQHPKGDGETEPLHGRCVVLRVLPGAGD